jgi:hypothetical protein
MNDQTKKSPTDLYTPAYTRKEKSALRKHLPSDQLNDELNAARITILRALQIINNQPTTPEFIRLAWIIFHGTRTIAYLTKTSQSIQNNAPHDFDTIMAQIISEIADEQGWQI